MEEIARTDVILSEAKNLSGRTKAAGPRLSSIAAEGGTKPLHRGALRINVGKMGDLYRFRVGNMMTSSG